MISKLKDVNSSSSDLEVISGVQSYHVMGFSLEAYCCLVRFLYTNKIEVQVNFEDVDHLQGPT